MEYTASMDCTGSVGSCQEIPSSDVFILGPPAPEPTATNFPLPKAISVMEVESFIPLRSVQVVPSGEVASAVVV
ncbi:hypothetical protein D3C73_735080 [compost metagenome]